MHGFNRRTALVGAALSTAFAGGAGAQPKAGKVARIAFATYAGGSTGVGNAMKPALAALGYREGETAVFLERGAGRDKDLMKQMAEEIVAWKPDVIVGMMTNADLAVQEATRENKIPIVFWCTDPVQSGLVKSWNKPGGNMTGFSYVPYHQLLELRVLKLARPKAKMIGHLYNPTYAPAPSTLRELKRAGEELGVGVKVYQAMTVEEITPAFAAMEADGMSGCAIGPHELFNTNGPLIGGLSIKHNQPCVGLQDSIFRGGGLACYPPPFRKGWPAMAAVVDRIIKGENPADIPVDRSFMSPLMLNLGAARKMGIDLPQSLIDQADVLLDDKA